MQINRSRWCVFILPALAMLVLPWYAQSSGIVASAYNLVQNGGSSLTMRTTINCTGALTCSDVGGKTQMDVTAGPGGSVTSVATGCGLSGGPITTSGTIIRSETLNAQTGVTYTVLNADCGKLVTLSNAGSIAVTLPQAGSGGNFISGWVADLENLGAGTVTVTPTTSTIDGAASLTLTTNQGVRIASDGTNYFTLRGRENNNGTVTSVTCGAGLTGGAITASGTCAMSANSLITSFGASFDGAGSAIALNSTTYFTLPYACTVSAWNITVDQGTITIDIWKIATGTAIPTSANKITASAAPAIASGTAIHSTTLTGWTTSVAANDIFGISVTAVSLATTASLIVQCDKA